MGLSPSLTLLLLAFLAGQSQFVDATKRACYGAVGGANGHIYQFDGGHVTTFASRGCQFLLARSQLKLCNLELFASFGCSKSKHKRHPKRRHGLSRLRALTVKIDGKEFKLLRGQRLRVSGKPVNVPFSQHGIRAFYSGEDLVLVSKKCAFWVTFDGHWTGTFRFSSIYRDRVTGLAGNCDGKKYNDNFGSLSRAYKLWKSKGWVKSCQSQPKTCKCRNHNERRKAETACRRVIGRHGCSRIEVLQPCIIDYCSTRYRPDKQKKVLCANFYLHSRRCARHKRPLAWRHKSGCALKCGQNQHFSRKANPCPKTCDNHFFGIPRRCYKLPQAEGCRCNKGYLLDGSKCVKPKHCECLAKLCIDRVSHSKCRRWKAQNRCRRYPEVMGRFCRLTCGMCRPHCRNQISTPLCEQMKKKGKCSKKFYRAMCQATCQPKKCRCSPKRQITSKCTHKYRNKAVTTLRWFPDSRGRCQKSTLTRYYPCGSCPYRCKVIWGKCNYCKGVQHGSRKVQSREKHGKRRCINTVVVLRRKCPCPPVGKKKSVTYTECRKNVRKVRITKTYTATKSCSRCQRKTKIKVLKTIKCHGSFRKGTCTKNRDYTFETIYGRYPSNCRCLSRAIRRRKIRCRCGKPKPVTVCKGNYYATETTKWKLKDGRCIPSVVKSRQRIPCKKNYKSIKHCQRSSCKATKHISYFYLHHCKCKKFSNVVRLGKCCCPSQSKRTVRVNRYWNKLIIVTYVLIRYKCHKRVLVHRVRIACPKGGLDVKCEGRKGRRIFTKHWFVKKGNCCIKKTSKKQVNIKCRHKVKRRPGPCRLLFGNVRYRRVDFFYKKRRPGSCVCVRAKRSVKEMCGCRGGKYNRVTRCPRGCTSKNCSRRCKFSREFYYYKAYGKHCRIHIFKRLNFRCCCRPDRRVKKWCKNNHLKMRQISYYKLKSHKCQRVCKTSSKRVRCNKKSETKRIRHPKKGLYYLATYHWYVSKCKCLVRVTKRVCRKHCKRKTKVHFCDAVRREKVTRYISWRLQGCNKCVRQVRDRRVPVRCSRKIKRWKHCNKRTGVVIHYKQWWHQRGCKCLLKKSSKRLRCECPKASAGRSRCNRSRNAFEKKITYWILSRGHCLKRSRTKRSKVKCSSKVYKKTKCKPKSGVKIFYVGVMRPKKCKCVLVWSARNKRQRCNCRRENKLVKGKTRRFCDKRRNRKGRERFYYVLVRGKCVRRSRKTYRSFRCPRAYNEKRICNEARRLQLVLKHYSVKKNCRCVKVSKRKYVKCGCNGKKIEHKSYCKRVQGELIKIRTTRRWSNRRHTCITKNKTTSHRVFCRIKKRYINSKCIKNKYYVETKIYYVRKGCKCVKKQLKLRRNCHCKRIIRRGKCPRRGYTRREVIEIRHWDMKRRRCRTKRYVTRHIRCRCPKGYKRRYCKAGKWVKESVRFILKKASCYKKVSKDSRKVKCRRVLRHRYEPCKGCHRYHYTLERRLHPGRCTCYFAVIRKRRCPCCCAKASSKRRCARDNEWERLTTHYAPLTGRRCGCRSWKTRRREKVRCSSKKTYKWLKCNRSSCYSQQQVTYYKAKSCQCRKRQRRTGKKRVCCCKTKPQFEKFCKSSSIYEKKIYYQLHRWSCKRRTSQRLLRRWSCNKRTKLRVGKCNRATCRQSVNKLVYVVARPRCQCHYVVRKRYTRPCCCNKRPSHTKCCEQNCWVRRSTRYTFDSRLRVCVAHSSRKSKCVKCPKPSQKVEKCNKKYCRQRIAYVKYSIKNCQCKKNIYYQYKICCCNRPTASGPVCRKNLCKVWSYTSWKLVRGKCVRKVEEKQRKVYCPKGVTRVLNCNKRTCRQTVRHQTVKVNRCRCSSSWRDTQRTCCCRPAKYSNTKCERQRYVYRYVTTRTLNHQRVCVSSRKKHLVRIIGNCRTTEKRGSCNKLTRHSTVHVFHRRISNCKCVLYRRSSRKVLCRCPGQKEQRSKCNKTTCFLDVLRTRFTSHGKHDKFKCIPHHKKSRLRCCCHRRPTNKSFCDQRTGSLKKRHTWTMFLASSRTCVQRHSVSVVKRLSCPRNKCHFGKCNKKTGYKVRYCSHFTKARKLCTCIKKTTHRKIICSCPRSHRKSICKGHTKNVTVHTYWKLSVRLNRCIRMVKRVTSHLVCPRSHSVKRKCSGCRGVKYIHKYRMHRCRCRRKTRSHPVLCCCPKPHSKKRCLGNQWLVKRVKYKLCKGVCKKTVHRKKVLVTCRKKRSKRGKCNNCIRKHETLYYHLQDCKCRLRKRKVRKSLCCCPKPQKFVQCKGGVQQKVCESWSLCSGKCLKKRHVSSSSVICPRSSVKHFSCNTQTLRQKVNIVSYVRRGCKCKKLQKTKHVACKCRNSKKKFEKCGKGSKRRVYRITFQLLRLKSKILCKRKRHLLYWEPCYCGKLKQSKKCASNGKVITTVVKSWRLCRSHGRKECLLKRSESQKLVTCRGKGVSWTNCKKFRKFRVTTKYKPVHCKCQRTVTKKVFACNCAKKSFKKRICDQKRGTIVFIDKSFRSCCNDTKCRAVSRKSYKPVHCSKRKRISRLSRKCGTLHNHGWYTKYLLTWKMRKGCKCVSKKKKLLKLCRCKANSRSTRCSLSGRYYVTVRYTYKRKGSVCHLKRSEKRRPVVCSGKKVQIRSYGCAKCRRQVSLKQCYVHSCRIRHYRKSAMQRCCTPKSRERHYCDAKRGRIVWKTTTYHLVPSKPLLKDRNGRVRVLQLKVVAKNRFRYVSITCPKRDEKEHCNRLSGRWRKTVTVWNRVGCKCVKKLRRQKGRCRCPSAQVRWGKCRSRYMIKTVISFNLKNRACVRQVDRRKFLCACLKNSKFTVCDRRGYWKTCHVRYQLQFRRQRCVKKQNCKRRRHTCSAHTESRGPCIKFRRVIKRYVWRLDKKRCKCVKSVHPRRADCNCHKRKHSNTVCKRGALITTIFRYKQKGERCVPIVNKVIKPVYCDGRRRSKIVRGSCVRRLGKSHRGYQKLLTEWKINKKCRCKRRHIISWVPCVCSLIRQFMTRKSSKCVRGSVVLYTTLYYQLIRHRCVKRVKTFERKIHCVGSKTTIGKCKRNKYGDKYSEIRLLRKVSNGKCGCVWKQRSLKYKICQCRKGLKETRCLKNRVLRTVLVTFHAVSGKRVCRLHQTHQDTKLRCKRPFVKKTKCDKCNFIKYHYAYKHINCKCVVQQKGVQRLKCCCPKPVTTRKCDSSRHMKVTVTISYKLRRHVCHAKKTVGTRRVQCDRKKPVYKFSACRNGFRKVLKTVHFAVGCGCKKKTTVYKQRCACPTKRIYRRGKCGGWFALDTWLAYKLKPTGKNIPGTNKPQKKCVKYVADRRKRRCRCPKGYKKTICKAHNLKILVTITFVLRGNSCQRSRTEGKTKLPCSTKPRLVQKKRIPRKCSKRNGYFQIVKYVYVQAKHCRCVRVTRKYRRICDCLKKYGQKKKTRCVGQNRLVTHTKWRVPKGYGCKKRTRKSVLVVRCKGGKMRRGKCGRNGQRVYKLYQRRVRNCRCVWHLVKRVAVPCKCRKTVATKKCESNHWVTVTKQWNLVGKTLKVHCEPVTHVHKQRVPCKVGRFVRPSKCNYRGVKHFVITEFTLRKCHCLKRVTRRSCRCHCRKPSTRHFCRKRRILVTVKTTFTLKNCVCSRDSKESRKSICCKKSHRTSGPCKRGRNGDRYRKLTHTHWLVHHCKCRRIHTVSHRLCGCDKRRRVKRSCRSGFIRITKIYERRLVRGRCRRVRIVERRKRLNCGAVKVKKLCHKKSGRLSIFVTKPYVKRCRCFRKVTRHSRRCGCHHGVKLVSIGKCIKKSCRQRLLFKKQVLRDEKCIWKKFHRHRVCCCKGYRRQIKCNRKRGYVITIVVRRVLKHWNCIKVVSKSSKRIKCKRNNTQRKQKLPRGVLKVTRCSVKRRGCKCVKRCKIVFLRYSCKKAIRKFICSCSCSCCRRQSHITMWKLVNGRCLKQIRRLDKPIHCKSNKLYRTRCNKRKKYGFYYVETSVSWHQKSCRCHKRVRTRSVVCRCLKAYSRKFCHRGHFITVKTSFHLRRGRCVKVVKRRSQAVKCRRTWRFSHRTSGSPLFFKVYKRFVRSGCKCVRRTRRLRCFSSCHRCTSSRRCKNGSQVVTTRVCWRKVGCRCLSYNKVTRRHVRCPKSSRKQHCHLCNRRIFIKQYNIRKCKCIASKRVIKNKCCCPKPKTSRACIRGTKRIRRITHKLRNGRCYSNTKDTYRPVNCSRRVLRAIHGKCRRSKQKYSVHFWVKSGCRCVRRVRHEFRKCVCAKKAIDLFLVVDLYGKERHGYKKRIVNFLKTGSFYLIHTSATVHITLISYNWNVYVHKLKSLKNLPIRAFTEKKTDLLGALKEVNRRLNSRSRSGAEKIVVIISCGIHSKQRKTVAIADKIKRKASVFVLGFRPIPRSGRFVKWLASNPTKLHYMEIGIHRTYRFSATRLFERICKKACAKPVMKHSKCHKHNCRRVYTRITFHLDQRKKKCVRRSNSWWKLCCCVRRGSVHKKCRSNRLYRVVTTYRFRQHVCHRRVRRYDISSRVHAACQPRLSRHRGPCCRDGWKKETTVTRYVAACRCRLSRRHRLIRCRCPKPHVRSVCVGGNRVQHCRYTYTLRPSACVTSRKCQFKRVICKRRRTFKGKCNRSSCKRSMGRVWFSIRNCKCQRHCRNWKEICCCKRKYQKIRYCDKRRNQRVEVHSWLEFHKLSCRRVSRKIIRPVHCPKMKVKRLRCTARRDGFYRKRVEHHWKKKDCCCIKYRKSRFELCKCRRGYTKKKCHSGTWVFFYHWWQKAGNKCIRRHRITSRRLVTCSSRRYNKVGRCKIRKGVRKYARVLQTWQRRFGCGCKTVQKVFLKLCACQKPYKRYSCQGNSRQVVTEYRFAVHGSSCKLRKRTNYRMISCPKARTKVSKCIGKTQAVTVILHNARKCKCVSKPYKRLVRCKSKCRDLLPTGICKKWAASSKIRLCDKYPYFAKRLCARTCHRCYGCPKTRVIYAGNFCLSKQRNFQRSFILAQRSSFDVCMRSCRQNRKCRAFDYDHSTRKCVLLRLNRGGLLLRFPSLRLRKTRGCILFERICPKKCPFRRVLKQYRCSCIKFGKARVCYRTAAVATWKRGRNGRCTRRVHKLRVPCRKCEDRREFCKKSKCSKHLVRHLCNFTCGVCKRRPRGYHHRSRCSKSGWQKDTRVDIYYDKKLRLWRVRVTVKRLRCVRCSVGSYRLIGQCKNGKRKLTKIVARFVHNRCHVSSHSKFVNCKDCALSTKKVVSRCHRRGKQWIRKVVTKYTMRLNGSCVVRQSLAVFSCSPKCKKDRVNVSQCKCGKRIRCSHYYVTYPGSQVCVPKRYTASEKCASAQSCRDKIRPIDCLFVKKNNMCRSMRNLCAKTCGYCKRK